MMERLGKALDKVSRSRLFATLTVRCSDQLIGFRGGDGGEEIRVDSRQSAAEPLVEVVRKISIANLCEVMRVSSNEQWPVELASSDTRVCLKHAGRTYSLRQTAESDDERVEVPDPIAGRATKRVVLSEIPDHRQCVATEGRL